MHLRRLVLRDITDLQQMVPGLQFGENGSKTPAIYIRGIGQREGSAVLDPGVGVYLNGIFLARQDTLLLDTVDTQSIQVLRGPQGTLFGKNNTGGAMLVTTRAPDSYESEFGVTIRGGNYGREDIKLYGNLPIVNDKLAARFGLSSTRLDGDVENTDGTLFGDENRLAVTLRTLWQASDNFEVDLFTFWSSQEERSTWLSCLMQNPTANVAALQYPGEPSYLDACQASEDLTESHQVSINSSDSVVAMKNAMLGVSLSWNVADHEIKSVSAWSHQYDIERNDDNDGTSIQGINNGTRVLNDLQKADGKPVTNETRDQFSQEFQFIGSAFNDRVSYTIGAFTSLEIIRDNPFAQTVGPKGLSGISPETFVETLGLGAVTGLLNNAGLSLSDAVVFPLTTVLGGYSSLENKSWAVFSQFTWDITDLTQLTVGGRYTHEKRERKLTAIDVDELEYGTRIGAVYLDQVGFYTPILRAQFDALGNNLPDIPFDIIKDADVADKEWSNFSPSVTLSVKGSDDWLSAVNMSSAMLYLTYSEGFKAGGFEPKGSELVPFDPEEVVNYELGFKLESFDSKLRFNTALYSMDYNDIQVRVAEQGQRISDIFLFLSNAGQATIQGLEMEGTLLLGNWVFNGNANYMDAGYNEYTGKVVVPGQGESVVDRSAEPFALVPETSYSMTAQYNWQTPVGLLVPRLTVYYRSELYIGVDNLAPNYETSYLEDLTLVSARLNYFPSEQLRVAAYVNNVTDKQYYKTGFAVSAALGSALVVQGQARIAGLELSYDF